MNGAGYGPRQPAYRPSHGDMRYQSAPEGQYPPTKVLVDGYRNTVNDVDEETPRFNPVGLLILETLSSTNPKQLNPTHPRSSSLLNVQDPVAMHLLMETAMADSMEYEVLSYEEAEELKKEYSLLSNRIHAAKRKLALENKLREAAQSMNRLYSTKARRDSAEANPDGTPKSPRKQRRSLLGRRESGTDGLTRTDDELASTTRKCEEIAQEIWRLERRAQDLQRRVLEHTAGILQMTHKGLKKNIRKDENPQTPEMLLSYNSRNGPLTSGIDDFDDRSLYRDSDYTDEYGSYNHRASSRIDTHVLQDTGKRLEDLNSRLKEMVSQANPEMPLDMPPRALSNGILLQPEAQLHAHLAYLESGLEAMDSAQTKALQNIERTVYDTEERLEDLNIQLHSMMGKSNSNKSPTIPPPPTSSDGSMEIQMSYLGVGLDHLEQRIERFLEEKSILTTQIQQQRELNTKSDTERDTHISDLTQQLAQAKSSLTATEQEVRGKSDELVLIMEQLDFARQDSVLKDQQRGLTENNALEAAEESRQQAEEGFMVELKSKQDQITALEGTMTEMRNEADNQAQRYTQQLRELYQAKDEAETEGKRFQAEMKDLEGEVVRAQTELTVVRAELDGAYGSRAQRAADVSANPAIQKEIDDLNDKNMELKRELEYSRKRHDSVGAGSVELQENVATLRRELKDTIEDYELMTRASIEFEKERDAFENMIDGLRERSEQLETQLSDEKVRWLGMRSTTAVGRDGGPVETTSSMVLKNEFKKMMRDTRTENMKSLRVLLSCSMFSLHTNFSTG